MKVEQDLNVSAKAFFDLLTEGILYDIKEHTGKNVRASQLKPKFNYKKKLSGAGRGKQEVTVKILEYKPNTLYSSVFTSSSEENTIRYEIKEVSEEKIRVTYSETWHSLIDEDKKPKDGFWAKRAEHKVAKRLKSLEKAIKQAEKEKQKKAEEEEKTS